jgi:exopolyphosphatase/guanosine-5'-triphosphate,3'-diphosphate pyrophosphatase
MTDRHIVAALDLGTNTFKLTIARCSAEGFEEFHSAADVVRLGRSIGPDGRIVHEAMDRVILSLTQLEREARDLGADVFIGAATQALRTAANGEDLMARVRSETAWMLEVITGEEEATLTFEGLREALPSGATGLIVDIGGGSTELVLARDRQLHAMESHLVGSGNLTDRFVRNDPPSPQEIAKVRGEADRVLDRSSLAPTSPIAEMLLAGGAGQFLDALSQHLWSLPLSIGTIGGLEAELQSLPSTEIASAIHIPVERAKVLAAGHQIALSATRQFRPEAIRAVPSGIRTGLIARWCAAKT